LEASEGGIPVIKGVVNDAVLVTLDAVVVAEMLDRVKRLCSI
jgi:hypothetical protein